MAEATVTDLKIKLDGPPFTVTAAEQRPSRTQFLSNVDQFLVATAATITFFGPCPAHLSFDFVHDTYRTTMEKLLLHYDFLSGRLRFNDQENRLEIDCSGQGVLLAWASSELSLADLGDITVPNPAYRDLTLCNHLTPDGPLFSLQVTRFSCGSFAVGVALSHCTMDGLASHDFTVNLAAITRGETIPIQPFMDRTLLKARNPPRPEHEHLEFMKLADSNAPLATTAFSTGVPEQIPKDIPPANTPLLRLFSLSGTMLGALKAEASGEGRLKKVSSFEAATAHLWRTRFLAMDLADDSVTTVLFPIEFRSRMDPPVPREFAGNAVLPGYARATVKELREEPFFVLVERVQEGLRRMTGEYVRSAIDWLEINKGVPCLVNSFSVTTWLRLELSAGSYPWGLPLHLAPAIVHGFHLVFLLPPKGNEAGFNVAIALEPGDMERFARLLPSPSSALS